jgi:hypothetical protein
MILKDKSPVLMGVLAISGVSGGLTGFACGRLWKNGGGHGASL